MDQEALLKRIRRLEDGDAIRKLCSRYSLAVDNHDFPTLRSLFAPDAIYGWINEAPHAEGAEAIGKLLESRLSSSGPSFHVNHDVIIDWDDGAPGRASGIVFCHAEVSPPAGQFIGAIRYHDKYVNHDGSWKFAERWLGFLYLAPPQDYAGLLRSFERIRSSQPQRPAHWPSFA